jgi:hypothetical protein
MLRAQLGEVLIKKPIGHAHKLVIESLVTALPAPNQEDRRASGVEGVEDSDRFPAALNPQFAHRTVPRSLDVAGIRKR